MKPQIVKLDYLREGVDWNLELMLKELRNINVDIIGYMMDIMRTVKFYMSEYDVSYDSFYRNNKFHRIIFIRFIGNNLINGYLIDIWGIKDKKIRVYKDYKLKYLYDVDYKISGYSVIKVYQVMS